MRKNRMTAPVGQIYKYAEFDHLVVDELWLSISPQHEFPETSEDQKSSSTVSIRRRTRRTKNQSRLKKGERTKAFNHPYEVQAKVVILNGLRPRRRQASHRNTQFLEIRNKLRDLNISFKLKKNSGASANFSMIGRARLRRARRIPVIKHVYFETYSDFLIANLTSPDMFESIRIQPEKEDT